MTLKPKIVALCGGVGGAKLALGLSRILPPEHLTIIVNTGDDFTHLGLHVSPDIDTVVYTLAGLSNQEQGWGLEGETWHFMQSLERIGGETWFRLGDADLAMHVERTRRLAAGETLTAITQDLAARLGIGPVILPMSDASVRTILHTDEGILPFQDYFVRRRTEPSVERIEIAGAAEAAPAPAVQAALDDPALGLVIICPSNPWLSVLPILETGDMRARLAALRCPVVAVTPVIAGAAVKGPTARLMAQLGLEVSAVSVARFYAGLADGFLLDEQDRDLAREIVALGMAVATAPTLMTDLESRVALARAALEFAWGLDS
ncbi:MAG: 2-phospho-L-lactate transferase [Aliidongia sp.]